MDNQKINHTPAPWIFKEQGDANNYVLLGNEKRWIFSFQQNGEIWTEEQIANAKLIAAAPDLLSALQELATAANAFLAVNGSEIYNRNFHHIQKALEVINKATK